MYSSIRQWKSLSSWNALAQVLVLIFYAYNENEIDGIRKNALREFLEYNMFDVNIISFRTTDRLTVDVVTWLPFTNGDCATDVTDLYATDKCEITNDVSALTEYSDIMHKIPKLLSGCKLRVSTSIQEPYVYYNHTSKTFDGLEIELVKNIAARADMIPEFVLINEVRSNRVVSKVTGIYANLLQG